MKEQDIVLANAYLEGALSNEEQTIFNKKMEEDTAFKEYVNFEIQMQESLSDSQWSFIDDVNNEEVQAYKKIIAQPQTQELKENLKNLFETKVVKPKSKSKIWLALAAMLVVCISLFSVFSPETNDDLFATYLDTNEIPSLVVRSDNTTALNTIQQLFDDKKYPEIVPLINDSLLLNSPSRGTLLIIKGISQIETNNNKDALSTFDTLINSDSLDASKGYWYKALAYLKIEDIENCKIQLSKIIENNLYNSEKAKQLLKELS